MAHWLRSTGHKLESSLGHFHLAHVLFGPVWPLVQNAEAWNRCFHFCIPYIYILYFLYVPDSLIRSVAVCAGSGSSVLRGVKADLWITGEMSHHEVLEANHNQTSVILCEHTNTERGYLYVLKLKLDKMFDEKLIVCVSKKDRDPLCVV